MKKRFQFYYLYIYFSHKKAADFGTSWHEHETKIFKDFFQTPDVGQDQRKAFLRLFMFVSIFKYIGKYHLKWQIKLLKKAKNSPVKFAQKAHSFQHKYP